MLAGDDQRGVQALEAVDALRPDCGAQRQPRVLVGGIQRGRVARTTKPGRNDRVTPAPSANGRLARMLRSRLAQPLAAALLLLSLLAAPAAAKPQPPLPAPPAAKGAQIAELFQQVTRATAWKLVDEVRLQAETWHPEGIVKLGDRWILSSVQVTEPTVKYPDGQLIGGTDRTPGAGLGHVMSFDASGKLLADKILNPVGALEHHPGGLDYDGRHLWNTLAQYRPNSTSTFLRIDPQTLASTPVLRAKDHFGGVVNDTARNRLVTLNWGSRAAASWRIPRRPQLDDFTQPMSVVRNPSHFVDYQDCKYLGRVPEHRNPLMLCGGITQYGTFQLGGIGLVDTKTLSPVWEVPITTLSPAGNVITRNPIDVDIVGGKLRMYLAPDDNATTVLTYEAEL